MRPLHPPRTSAALLLAAFAVAFGACGREQPAAPADGVAPALDTPRVGRAGGRLVTAVRSEPRSFNPLVPLNNPSRTVVGRLHADLVHINRFTQQTEPALAESWQVSADGLRYTLELRSGVRFSDGEPFDADDVVFTYEALLDEKTGAPNRDLLTVAGEPIRVRKLDPLTVEFELAAPYAVGERMFDSIAVLPEHRLREAWEEGRLAEAWGLDTPPAELAGLGPFRLRRYVPGDRLVVERNPHYWRRDAEGQKLPYLDEITFLFVASEDAQAIRLQSGEIDVADRLSAKNFAVLERDAESAGLRLQDLGPSLEYTFLFFNLNDLDGRDLEAVAARQAWFRDVAFRRAVSEAIDREAMARLVYDGRATPLGGHVTPGNKLWHDPEITPPAYSPDAARERLAAAGFRWSGEDRLLDARGEPVAFTLITNSGNVQREQMATLLQEDLRQIGIEVDFVPLEFRTMVQRVLSSFDYEACLLGLGGGDVDPNSDLPVYTSGGATHLWDMADPRATPEWQLELDRLLERQLAVMEGGERRRLYARVQEIVAERLPLIPLLSPNVLVGAKVGLGNFRPAVMQHPTLWNADELFWKTP